VRGEGDLYHRGDRIGSVAAIDAVKRTVDIKKMRKTAEIHPSSVYMWDRTFDVTEHAEALWRIGTWVAEKGVDGEGSYRPALDLLLRKAPRLIRG
jgi:uncharacterized protein